LHTPEEADLGSEMPQVVARRPKASSALARDKSGKPHVFFCNSSGSGLVERENDMGVAGVQDFPAARFRQRVASRWPGTSDIAGCL